MRAGSLNQRITIQSPSNTQDSLGQPLNDWTDICTVWASVSDISGKEYVSAASERSEVTTRIIIRIRDDIRADMRIVHGTDIYNILAVLKNSRYRQLQLMCKRHGN